MINLDAVKSLTHCLFGLSAEQRDDRMGVSTEKAHSTYGNKQTTLSYTTHLIRHLTANGSWTTLFSTLYWHPISTAEPGIQRRAIR
jgi:hypothetical protein